MLKAFLHRIGSTLARLPPSAVPPGPVTTPEGVRIYAVGDIHGQARILDVTLDFIRTDAETAARRGRRSIAVFLGDYVDRGPQSRSVLERLSQLEPGLLEWIFLAGNHEAALLRFLDRPQDNAAWLGFGGGETLASYGILPPSTPAPAQRLRACRDALADAMPPHHLDFLRALRPIYVCGDYAFVHAGMRPGIPLTQQHPDDLMWIRDEFLGTPHWHGKCVVHGHTIEPQPALYPWRIGIDTGAYAGGELCCLVLEDLDRRTVFPARTGTP